MLKEIKKLWELIKSSDRILLINHIRMDMDAFWSLSALYELFNALWKDVRAINDELPIENFSFLWLNKIIEPDLDVKKFNPELIISLDTAGDDRLWVSYSKNIDVFNKAYFVVIDHHKTNLWFWKLNIIDSLASSTSEMVFEIIIELGYEKYITPKIATALLSWIYTDTNIFYNSNTTAKTHTIAAKLMEYWADFRKPYYELYKKKTLSQAKLWWEVIINHMKVSKNWKLIWAMVPKTVFEKVWSSDRELEGLISEFFTNIEGAEVCFISHEIENNIIKTSFRSTPSYDVSLISWKFWWWWHHQASWCTSTKKINEVEKDILEVIKKEFNL